MNLKSGFLTIALLAVLTGCGKGESLAADAAGASPQIVDLAQLQAEIAGRRGTPFLLNFWATWCGPCVEEMPALVQVAEEFRGQGLQVLGVSYDLMIPGVTREQAALAVSDYQREAAIPFPFVVFEGVDYDAINAALRLPGPVPVTIAFDKNGREASRVETGTDLEGFRALARAALAGN